MSSGREKEFDQYARECVRLAEGVEDPELREKLLMYGLMGRPAYRVVPKAQNPTKRHNKSDQGLSLWNPCGMAATASEANPGWRSLGWRSFSR